MIQNYTEVTGALQQLLSVSVDTDITHTSSIPQFPLLKLFSGLYLDYVTLSLNPPTGPEFFYAIHFKAFAISAPVSTLILINVIMPSTMRLFGDIFLINCIVERDNR